MKCRYLSALSSQLHPPLQIPEHTYSIERIDGTRTCPTRRTGTTAKVFKVERRGYMRQYLFVLITFRTFLRHGFAWLRRRSRLCAGGIPSRASSASATALALLRASDIDIGHVAFVVFGCPFTTSLDSPQCSGPYARPYQRFNANTAQQSHQHRDHITVTVSLSAVCVWYGTVIPRLVPSCAASVYT